MITGMKHLQGLHPSEELFSLEREYSRIRGALSRTEILLPLPRSKSLGIIGIDGKEYPLPSIEQLQELFAYNRHLVERKVQQGFRQLQLIPMALATSQLIERVKSAILIHASAGRIIRTKKNPTDEDTAARVNAAKPLWVWNMLGRALDTSDLIYFPRIYADSNHQGLAKEEVMQERSLCALQGWSVGLIEPTPIMPQAGQGVVMVGRKQIEAGASPRDYLKTISAPPYQGETGWTLEDFLTYFATQLEMTNQVSHDRYDGNALWLIGSYLPNSDYKGLTDLVPVAYWDRIHGRIYISAHRSGNRLSGWVARSMVRLGI